MGYTGWLLWCGKFKRVFRGTEEGSAVDGGAEEGSAVARGGGEAEEGSGERG